MGKKKKGKKKSKVYKGKKGERDKERFKKRERIEGVKVGGRGKETET